MKRQMFTRSMTISTAGPGSGNVSVNIANARLIGVQWNYYALYSASAFCQAILTRYASSAATTGTEGVLIIDTLYAPINGACGNDRSFFVPLDFIYKYPEALWIYTYAGSGVTSSIANATLYLEQL